MLISITGPECSGKTTLTHFLARTFDLPTTEEYARSYLNERNGHYVFADLDIIAKGQLELVQGARKRMSMLRYRQDNISQGFPDSGSDSTNTVSEKEADGVLLTDTFLLVVVIWSLFKFGKVSPKVKALYDAHQPDFYVLCSPDLEWEPDALRENEHDRNALFDMYLDRIRSSGIPYCIVQGEEEKRAEYAEHVIRRLIQNKVP